jgi:hypothetical protein
VTGEEGRDERSRAWVAPETVAGPESARPAPQRPPPGSGAPEGDGMVEPPVPLGPMTVSGILDGSFAVIKRRPRAVLVSVALIIVPVQVLSVYLQRSALVFDAETVFAGSATTLPGLGSSALGPALFAGVVHSLSLFFVGGVVATFVSGWYAGSDPSAGEAVRASLRRAWPFAAAWFLLTPLKVVSALACYLPVFVTVTFFALTAPAIVIEGLGPLAGIKRSAQLVVRRFWFCLGIVVLSALVQQILELVFTVIPTFVAALLPDPLDWIVLAVGQSGASLLTTTAVVAASVLLYLDVRIRTEGLDLDLRVRRAFPQAAPLT